MAKSASSGLADSPPSALYRPTTAPLKRADLTWLGLAVLLGGSVRLLPLGQGTFPLRDGGMFYVMARNLETHQFALPNFTTYNAAHIPFAYPPLGLYLAAGLHHWFGLSWWEIFRLLPLVASLLSIPAFYLLAGSLLDSGTAARAATIFFALLPDAFTSEIQGGGVTRAFGLLFALLALSQIVRLLKSRDKRYLLPAGIFSGLTILSHLEWAWFVAYSSAFFVLVYVRRRQDFYRVAAVVLICLLVISPWLLITVARHGMGTILATLTGSAQVWPWYTGLLYLFALQLTKEPWFPLISALALMGVVLGVRCRTPLLAFWLVCIFVAEARAPHFRSVIVIALLAGVGFRQGVFPLLTSGRWRISEGRMGRGVLLLLALAAGWLTLAGMSQSLAAEPQLSPATRDVMQWARTHSPPESSFLVISAQTWDLDDVSEWFPALADRRSVATVQGYEWLPGGFAHQFHVSQAVQRCATRGTPCLNQAIAAYHVRVNYLYVVNGPPPGPPLTGAPRDVPCCRALQNSLAIGREYQLVYRNAAASIYRHRIESRG